MERNVPITMRDGTVLRADVYTPAGKDGKPAPGKFPVVVSETPYGKEAAPVVAGITGYEPYLITRGYIQAIVDVRGTGASGGTFELFGKTETADSVEVIKWASRLARSTGKVGMSGSSYLGMVQMFAAATIGPKSPLKAIFPLVAAHRTYSEIFSSGGITNLESDAALTAVFGGLAIAGPLLQSLGDPQVLSLLAAHAGVLNSFSLSTLLNVETNGERAYDESYWRQDRSPGDILAKIVANKIPAYLVGALWDVYQEGEPLNYAGLQNAWAGRPVYAPMKARQKVTGRYQLLQKATYHSDVESAGKPDVEPIRLAWFERWLKGVKTGIEDTKTPLHVTQPGGQRLDVARYPLPDAIPERRYFEAGGKLSSAEPKASSGADTVLFSGGSLPCDRALEQWSLGLAAVGLGALGLSDPCADHDIVPQSIEPLQLVYTTGAFGSSQLLAGPITARIYAKATTKDTEWVVKLSDVAPDGTATDLTQGALLGSFRALDQKRTWRTRDKQPLLPIHPFTRASVKPVVPGEVTRYDVDVRPTFATIAKGHRLRLTLLTSQLPHLLPIPRQMIDLIGGVYEVQRRAGAASYVQLPLAPARGLAAVTRY